MKPSAAFGRNQEEGKKIKRAAGGLRTGIDTPTRHQTTSSFATTGPVPVER